MRAGNEARAPHRGAFATADDKIGVVHVTIFSTRLVWLGILMNGARDSSRAPCRQPSGENQAPDTANPASGGAAYRPRPGKTEDLDNHQSPRTQAPRQAKTLFSRTRSRVPISGPPGELLCSPNGELMPTLAYNLPALPGFAGLKTYAAWPVWSGSATQELRFQPMPKKAAVRLWHRARDFDRQSHVAGRHGGAVGPAALQVLHALIFDFLNFRSGQLDPSHATLARAAGVCERTVRNALRRLKALGILNWVRRCVESWRDGRFVLEQETNAYAVLPATQWHGYRPPPEPPGPAPSTWGDHPPLPSTLAQAVMEQRRGGTVCSLIEILDGDPGDALATALARLGRSMQTGNPQ